MIRATKDTIFTMFGAISRSSISHTDLKIKHLLPGYDEGISGEYIPVSPIIGYIPNGGTIPLVDTIIAGRTQMITLGNGRAAVDSIESADLLLDLHTLFLWISRYASAVFPVGSDMRNRYFEVNEFRDFIIAVESATESTSFSANKFKELWAKLLIRVGSSFESYMPNSRQSCTATELSVIQQVADIVVFGLIPLFESKMAHNLSLSATITDSSCLFQLDVEDTAIGVDQTIPELFSGVNVGSGLCYMLGGPSTGKTTHLLGNSKLHMQGQLAEQVIYIPYRERHSSVACNQVFLEALIAACLFMRVPFAIDSMFMETVMNDRAKMMTGISRASFNNFISLSNLCTRRHMSCLIVVTWPSARADVAMEVLTMATASATALLTVKQNDDDSILCISHADHLFRRFIPLDVVREHNLFSVSNATQILEDLAVPVSPVMTVLTQQSDEFGKYFGFVDSEFNTRYSGVREMQNVIEYVEHIAPLTDQIIIND